MGNRVYFLYNRNTREIKIGQTHYMGKRKSDLERAEGCELQLLATIDAPLVERELHHKFGHLRTRGEWFRSTKELRDFIRQQRKQAAVDPVEPMPTWLRPLFLLSCLLFLICGIAFPVEWLALSVPAPEGYEWARYVIEFTNIAGAIGTWVLAEEIRGDNSNQNGHSKEVVR